jgi:Na+/H+ antiporter NhaD/arsenite permease-like protein
MLCVGGLATIGYLEKLSTILYLDLGNTLNIIHKQTPANITIGLLSSIVDNIPIMFALLTMSPIMSTGQWLLATLTTGIGGSLLSIGSAAGVALMGQSQGKYTFFNHLKWSWVILLGYCAGIYTHILINKELFHNVAIFPL